MTVIAIFILFFTISYFAIPQIVQYALKNNLVDVPDYRKVHKTLIPALGGVALFLCINIAYFLGYSDWNQTNISIYVGSFLIFIVGVIDDVKPLNAWLKLSIQILSGIILVGIGDIRIHSLFGVYGIYELNYWISSILSMGIILVLINALNLIDGINGLAASLGILYFGFFALFNGINDGLGLNLYICIAFVASLTAFLRYNLIRPIIFLGDTGSTLLGFFSGVFIISILNGTEFERSKIHLISPYGFLLALFIIPLFDTFRVALQRILKEKSPFSPDKTHIHHLFLRLGFKHHHITGILIFCNIFIVFLAFTFQKLLGDLLIVTLIIGFFVIGFFILEFFIAKKFRMRYNDSITIEKFRIFVANNWYLFFSIIVFALPFQRWATSIPIILYGILWAFSLTKDAFHKKNFLSKNFIPTLVFYLPTLYLIFFEHRVDYMMKQSTLFLPFILFPALLFLKQEYFDLKKWYTILSFYLLGILTFSGCFLIIYFIKYISFPTSILSQQGLILSNIPPIYYSLLLNFGVMVAIYLKKSNVKLLQKDTITFFIILLFSINILLIHSKIGFFTLSWILLFSSIISLLQIRKVPIAFYNLVFIFIYFILFIYQPEKLNIDYQQRTSIEVTKRIGIWNAGIQLIKEKGITGLGSETQTALSQINGESLNAHNLYLQTILEYGVLGIFILLIVFLFSFYRAYQSKDYFFKGFLVLIFSYSLFESLFSNQTGIVFFNVFNSLLLLKSQLRIKTASS